MKTLSRRTALAAVPALAAIPAMAATTNPDPLALSPRIAALEKERRGCIEQIERNGREEGRLSDAIKARGIARPELSPTTMAAYWEVRGVPPISPSGLHGAERQAVADEWEKIRDEYSAKYDAQPEAAELKRLDEAASELGRHSWKCLQEMLAIPAVTLGDLTTQVGALQAQTEGCVLNDDDEAFLRRVPSEIRRLAGGAS